MAEKKGKWNDEQVVLTSSLEVKYVDDEDDAPIRAIATIKKEDNTPLKDVPVSIFYEGGQVGQPVPSNDKGKVKLLTGFLRWGSYTFIFKVNDDLQVKEQVKVYDRAHRPKQQDEGNMAENNPRGGTQKKQQQNLSVQDPIYGEAKPLSDGFYEVAISVFVKTGDVPARGAEYQFYVDGAPFGTVQMVDPLGRAIARVRATGKSVPMRLQVMWRGQDRIFPLPDLELPTIKPKLIDPPLGTIRREDGLEIVLQRLGVSGKPEAGPVVAMDWDLCGEELLEWDVDENGILMTKVVKPKELQWQFLQWETGPSGILIVQRPYLENIRYINFFLSENLQAQVSVEIPGKKETSRGSTSGVQPARPGRTWSQIWRENYEKEKGGTS